MHRIAVVLLIVPCGALAQPPCQSYDAALGTTPDEQGWAKNVVEPATAVVIDGVLHQSTLPLANIVCNESDEPQNLNWRAEDVDYVLPRASSSSSLRPSMSRNSTPTLARTGRARDSASA